MIDNNYANAFHTIGVGMEELSSCIWNSFKKNSSEIAIGAWHHWLFTLIIIGFFMYSVTSVMEARLERDEASHQEVILQQQNDSMKCALGYDTKQTSRKY